MTCSAIAGLVLSEPKLEKYSLAKARSGAKDIYLILETKIFDLFPFFSRVV
jgi:hypothetical protein